MAAKTKAPKAPKPVLKHKIAKYKVFVKVGQTTAEWGVTNGGRLSPFLPEIYAFVNRVAHKMFDLENPPGPMCSAPPLDSCAGVTDSAA